MKKEMKKKLIWAGVIGGISAVVAGVIGYFAGQQDYEPMPDDVSEEENEAERIKKLLNTEDTVKYYRSSRGNLPTFELPHGHIVDYWTESYGDTVVMTGLAMKDIPETLNAFAQHENRDSDTQVNIILDLLNWRPEDDD